MTLHSTRCGVDDLLWRRGHRWERGNGVVHSLRPVPSGKKRQVKSTPSIRSGCVQATQGAGRSERPIPVDGVAGGSGQPGFEVCSSSFGPVEVTFTSNPVIQ